MRGFWIAVAYLLVLAALAHPLGQALPRRWFDGGRFPYRCYKWEKQGKLYTRIGIERWKKLVPDMSRFLPDMVKKEVNPAAVTASQVELLVQETCVAEAVHTASILLGLGALWLWPGWGGAGPLADLVSAGQSALHPHSTLQQAAAHAAARPAATARAAERAPMNILILTCNTGGGHNAVAASLTEAFRQRGADSRVLDGLSFVSRKASKFVSRWHTRFYRHYPQLYKAGYMSAEEEDGRPAPKHNPVETYLSRGARRLARYLQAERFDAVVCVHVIPALMMTMLRQNGGAPMPFCFVATDYTCSPTVGSCTPDICVIPHAELAEEFIHCGIAADTLLPAGIPTRSVFAAPTDRAAARQGLSLPAEGHHILLMSGSIGCGPMSALARQLDELLPEGDFATVLCGSNRQMLYAIQMRSLLRVQAVGFTSRVAQYMDSADLLVSKPGGISITEAACKGVPMLLADLVGGCETRNQAFFSAHGWAASCDTDAIADSALSLLADDDRRRRMVETQRRGFDGQAAQRIADAVLSRCGKARVLL